MPPLSTFATEKEVIRIAWYWIAGWTFAGIVAGIGMLALLAVVAEYRKEVQTFLYMVLARMGRFAIRACCMGTDPAFAFVAAHWPTRLGGTLLTTEQIKKLEPPGGWQFKTRPTLRTSGYIEPTSPYNTSQYQERARALAEWCEKNSIAAKWETRSVFRSTAGNIHIPATFKIKVNQPKETAVSSFKSSAGRIRCCSRSIDIGQSYCDGCYVMLYCQVCKTGGTGLHNTGDGNLTCIKCSKPCKNCGNRISLDDYEQGRKLCVTCDPPLLCGVCGTYVVKEGTKEYPGFGRVCIPCETKYKCDQCDTIQPNMPPKRIGEKKLCVHCRDTEIDKEVVAAAKFDPEELPVSGSMVIPSTKERPVRTISVETEVDGAGAYLARFLFRCGIVPLDRVAGYHQHDSAEDHHAAFLKHDGSVSAGELISYLLNMDIQEHADSFQEVLRQLKGLHKIKQISFNSNCGGHIHIDAHNFTYSDAWRLVTIWNYLEAVTFLLAGAGCSYGHRTLDPDHDRANRGQGYTKQVIKGPFGVQSTFGRALQEQDRMCGLNFRPYFDARHNCGCGEMAYDSGRNCKCNLGKATIEWRVWNSTGNPRILHAWIAYMQAVHAYAERDVSMGAKEERQFTAFPWQTKPFTDYGPAERESCKERLEWIHKNLPLTGAERDSLTYAFKKSQLIGLGEDYLDSLLQLDNAANIPEKKPPRNPNRRMRSIKIEAPAPGSVPVELNNESPLPQELPRMRGRADIFRAEVNRANRARR